MHLILLAAAVISTALPEVTVAWNYPQDRTGVSFILYAADNVLDATSHTGTIIAVTQRTECIVATTKPQVWLWCVATNRLNKQVSKPTPFLYYKQQAVKRLDLGSRSARVGTIRIKP